MNSINFKDDDDFSTGAQMLWFCIVSAVGFTLAVGLACIIDWTIKLIR